MLRAPIALITAALAALPSLAAAQATGDGAEDAEGSLVVRAGPARRSASDVTLEGRELRAVPRGGAADLLMSAPGFFLSSHGGEGKSQQIFLRGFDAQHGQDVEFNVGGLPVNEVSNVHGQGYTDLNFVIPEVVDRLRVLEGPFDPRQGDFAVAGSVRYDLGVAERGVLLRGGYGSYDASRAVVVVAPRGERRETFLAGELARGAGFGPNRAWSRAAAMAQYARQVSEGVTVRALASSYAARWDSAGVVRESDFDAGRIGFFGTYDPRQGGFSARHALVASLEVRRAREQTEVTLFAALRELRVRENFTGFRLDPRGDRYEHVYDAVTAGLAARHRRALPFGAAELGFSARHDATTQAMRRLGAMDDVPYATDADADVNATDVAVYADVEVTALARRLRVRGGLRADALAFQIDDRAPRSPRPGSPPRGRREAQGLRVGPKVTVEYELAPGVALLGSYGNGFRSPQAVTLGMGETAPFATVDAGEVGVRYRARGGSASLAAFATHVDRDLVFDPTTGTNVVIAASAATTRLGVAGFVRATPLPGVAVLLSGTYARATFDATGFLVPYVPTLVGRLDATFDRAVGEIRGATVTVRAGLGMTFLGYRPLPFSERADAVGLIDLGCAARIGPVELEAQVRNLTDARWRDGQFNYASNFDPGATPSFVPARHFTAGRPFTLMTNLTVYL